MFEINDQIIPSCVNNSQLKNIVENTSYEYVMLKMGDIMNIKKIVAYSHHYKKKVMLHIDSLKGIAKDKAGFSYLKKIGVDSIITMKPQQIKMIRDEGITTILGCFILDSSSLQLAIRNTVLNKPDAMLVMPMTIPDEAYRSLMTSFSIPVLAGGLGMSKDIIRHTLEQGVKACVLTDIRIMDQQE